MSVPAEPARHVRHHSKTHLRTTLSFSTLDMSLAVDIRLTLSSGASILQFGFGSTPETYASVTKALELGIRHCGYFRPSWRVVTDDIVDTAQMYRNEGEVAQAISDYLRATKIPRSSVFITTKWNPPEGLSEPGVSTEEVYGELQNSRKVFLDDHNLEYVDLMLVHQSRPGPQGRANHWQALVKAQADGWIKDIGVSNQ